MSAETVELLRQRLAVLHPESIDIQDDSHRHAGHAGARDGGHYQLQIVAQAFAGKSTMARHRLIYDAAGDLMRGRIHALSIRAKVPGEV
ncbi:MAG: BolA family transcriptional regulator [Gammaproteobacteria bacterium]|nr:BolA family transcriptional regulator [Gammaproteobacteria bacterium]MBU1601659.1 BolA family transcriptional regulator [Gammaproteobacteria bacterium]MBU2434738.1 BolA family transcriptional regulator [Gammaproteobacteria bacterium]MBU2447979.1 BolA family transcriptional regulator [Gammaproteobacteria bacterium]